ncbi:MAG: hypothetical protein MUP17_09295 [candidate division Zixibacteria bacterium]|nr:hypothetical protein [candidate division Zixibacteria bacterium]
MMTKKRILIVMLTIALWAMLGGEQTWCDDKPSPQKYLDLLEREFGTREPVAGVSKTVSLEELGPDAPTDPAWGPAEGKAPAPGCDWYYYWLPNTDLVNSLNIDFLKLRDPAWGQGPVNFFPGGLVIPPNSVRTGWVLVNFCATHLEVQYRLSNLTTKTNQAFWTNWVPYGFIWQWKHIQLVWPQPPPAVLFIIQAWDPPSLLPSDFCYHGQVPIDTATVCHQHPDSVSYQVASGGQMISFLTKNGLIGLIIVFLAIASWVFFWKRKVVGVRS